MSLLTAMQAGADSIFWTGATGDWHEALNWDNGIPADNDYVYIDNGGTAQMFADAESYYLYAGYNNSGAVEQTGGTNTVGGELHIGASSATGIYNLGGGVLETQDLTIFGTLNITDSDASLIISGNLTFKSSA